MEATTHHEQQQALDQQNMQRSMQKPEAVSSGKKLQLWYQMLTMDIVLSMHEMANKGEIKKKLKTN